MKRLSLSFIALLLLLFKLNGREFTVLVYNVENLFDLDGVALFEDYRQPPHGSYTQRHLLNKLEGIYQVLRAADPEHGPEVILFQEIELDRTPFGTPDAAEFLRSTRDVDLETLLAQDRRASNLPAYLLLLKYLADRGMTGYHIAKPDAFAMETQPPHKNVVFTRFPVRYVRQFDKTQARALLEVGLDIDGELFIVMNNHWKSGASNPEMEPIRVQNARVVRARLDALLLADPMADILVAGDLNSHYNQRTLFPDWPETAVNDVLRSTWDEAQMLSRNARGLYNLWFELPPAQRGSEVWRGNWGTLMQMLITPGLYDQRGIQYVDNSFQRLILPGRNADSHWQRPRRWSNIGDGAGFSDHLPILARFRVVQNPSDGWMTLDNPSRTPPTADRVAVDYASINRALIPSASALAGMALTERAWEIGEVFALEHRVAAVDPVRVRIGEDLYEVFSPHAEIRARINRFSVGETIRGLGDLQDWRGQLQFVVRDISWLQ